MSEDMEKELETVEIDEERNHVLIESVKTKKGTTTQMSDHTSIITKFNVMWNKRMAGPRIDMFNLKNKEGQVKFKELTSNCNRLTSLISNNSDLQSATKELNGGITQCITKNFQKIMITEGTG
jgi:hypothetical protein